MDSLHFDSLSDMGIQCMLVLSLAASDTSVVFQCEMMELCAAVLSCPSLQLCILCLFQELLCIADGRRPGALDGMQPRLLSLSHPSTKLVCQDLGLADHQQMLLAQHQ